MQEKVSNNDIHWPDDNNTTGTLMNSTLQLVFVSCPVVALIVV